MTYIYLLFIIILIVISFIFINNSLKNSIIENYTGIMTDNFYEEARLKNYVLNHDDKTITNCESNNECITKSYKKHFNTEESVRLAKNKIKTSEALQKNGIPIPKFLQIDLLKDDANKIIQRMNQLKILFPIILKPVNGTFGIDVITNIDNKEELSEYLQNFILKNYKEVMLEEQIEGDCYRIFVFFGKILDVIKREKPYVRGDAKKSIQELINIRNEEQKAMKLFPTKNVSELFLMKQGYKLTDIPEYGKIVYISNVINMHNGARISRIPLNNIPQKNIDIFIKTNKAIDINCSGIDYLSNNIEVEYDKNNSRILEVNGTPDTEIHTFIKFEENDSFFKRLVNQIYS